MIECQTIYYRVPGILRIGPHSTHHCVLDLIIGVDLDVQCSFVKYMSKYEGSHYRFEVPFLLSVLPLKTPSPLPNAAFECLRRTGVCTTHPIAF